MILETYQEQQDVYKRQGNDDPREQRAQPVN